MNGEWWPGKDRRYADCERCGMTTDPDGSVPGVDNPDDVTVVRTGTGFKLMHTRCHKRGKPSQISDYM